MCATQAGLVSKAFKELTDEEKKEYEELAAEDAQRYKREMKEYTPPSDDDEEDKDGGKQKKASKKKRKDPNAPKKALTAFMFFSNHMRDRVKEENPGISFGEVAKKIGQMFKALTEKEKVKWDEKADEDKQRYKEEMTAYKKKQGGEKAKYMDEDDDDDDSDEESD